MKRRFHGLRREEPRAAYDVVVIGAGIGGLVTAALLAEGGASVLLVEQHYMVGGYCSTFRRGGYTFDASSHFYPLLGNPETTTGKLLHRLGVETGWVKMDPVDTFHLPDGTSFRVPADLASYRAALDRRFPDQRSNLERFFHAVREAHLLGLLYYFRGRKTPRMAELEPLTVGQALRDHFDDPALRLVLAADCAHWGSPPSRTSFVFDAMLRLSYFLGNYYPVDGSQAFADELARGFEERGGHILTSTRVDHIRVGDDGRVQGVDMETLRGPLSSSQGGRRSVDALTVVSNADLRLTCERLLPRRHLPPELLERLRSLRPTYPCFLTHLGLQDVDTATLDRIQGYHWAGWDADDVGGDALRCKVFVPTLYEPNLAPDGGHVVVLQKVLDMAPATVTDWPAHKARTEARLLGHLRQLLPDLDRKIAVCTSATAHTAERFTKNYAGAMLGWEMSPDQLGDGRPGLDGPVDGLHLVGHWVRPGGGITPVIVSAQRVAERILGGRKSEVSRP